MKISFPITQFLLLAGDLILIIASLYLGPVIRFGICLDPAIVFGLSEAAAILVYLTALYIFNFYNLDDTKNITVYSLRFTFVILMINLINASLFYILHLRPYSSGIIAISGLISLVLLLGWRFAIFHYIDNNIKPLRVLIMGAGKTGMTLYNLLMSKREYHVVGFLDDDLNKMSKVVTGNATVLGTSECLMDLATKMKIDKIIVSINGDIKQDVFQRLVQAKFNGVNVYEMPTFYEKVAKKIPVLHTNEMWLGYADISGVKKNIYNLRLKKVIDKLLSLIGIILSSPLVLITILLIKIESSGPVLYRQKRVGWDEKEFELIKFRSMGVNAEANGAVWAQENDPRVTRVGRIIRKVRIDELPQLWNVLAGDMSFVGPRPERPEFVSMLKNEVPYYSLRHSMRPGITGWAQVNYPYGASKEDAMEKLQYDLFYIKNMSVFMDLYILLQTVRVMLFGKGAR